MPFYGSREETNLKTTYAFFCYFQLCIKEELDDDGLSQIPSDLVAKTLARLR